MINAEEKKRLKFLLKKINQATMVVNKYKSEFDSLVENEYGYHYSDKDVDEIIDCLDYGLSEMSFEEFDKIMKKHTDK